MNANEWDCICIQSDIICYFQHGAKCVLKPFFLLSQFILKIIMLRLQLRYAVGELV